MQLSGDALQLLPSGPQRRKDGDAAAAAAAAAALQASSALLTLQGGQGKKVGSRGRVLGKGPFLRVDTQCHCVRMNVAILTVRQQEAVM